jgi:hypothetical protein
MDRRRHDARRIRGGLLLCACVVVAPASSAHQVRAADRVFTLIDGPDRVLLDASDDGRYVLTMDDDGDEALLDTQTQQRSTLPPAVPGRSLSGDGRLIFFASNDQLRAGDTDSAPDIYSYAWATARTRLVSVGWAGWAFDLNPFENIDLQADHTGATTAFTGTNGAMASVAAFMSDGTTVTQIGSDEEMPSSAVVRGISRDGRYVLYDIFAGMFVYDAQTATRTRIDIGADVGAFAWGAVLSGDGRHVVTVTGPNSAMTTSLHHLDTGQVVPLGPFKTHDLAQTGLGISTDGSVVSLLRNTATDSPSGPLQWPGLFVWQDGVAIEASAPSGALASGRVLQGFVLPGGDSVVFTSDAQNLVAGTSPTRNIYSVPVPDRPDPEPQPTPTPTPTPEPDPTAPGSASVYTPRVPLRLLDTRVEPAMPMVNSARTIPLAGHQGVPADATAVAVQMTATGGTGTGFVGLTASGAPPGQTSNVNIDEAGETIANLAVVPLGADGAIELFTSAPTHLLVDLLGWWAPVEGATAAGRFVATTPARVIDTRSSTRAEASAIATIQVTGRDGIPQAGVAAVVVNITVDDPAAIGFVQAAAGDALVPGASSTLNVTAPGHVVAGASIVPVDAHGRIAVYTQMSTHLIVDVTGWFTDASASPSTSGRFVPAADVTRALDTRTGPKPGASSRVVVPVDGAAVVGNLTLTQTDAPGFVQGGPAVGLVPGATSTINATAAGETIANAFVSPIDGGIGIYTMIGTHLIVDVSGYMTR